MPTLFDIDQLQPLSAIARDCKVSFTLHGGVAFRFALLLGAHEELEHHPADLFALTPFTADVDLVHTGSPSSTARILDSILRDVPMAECFRWEVRSATDDQPYREVLKFGGIVPARLIAISSDAAIGVMDPASGRGDIRNRKFRYFRNPLFRESPLYRSGRDLEVFSALLYLQTLFEAGLSEQEITSQAALKDVEAVFSDAAGDDTIRRLQQHDYLRARLRYLFANCVASALSRQIFSGIASTCKLSDFMRAAANSISALVPEVLTQYLAKIPAWFGLAPSAFLGGDAFRLPLTTTKWTAGQVARGQLKQLNDTGLGPGHNVLMASPVLPLEPGTSPSSAGGSSGPMEFVHFDLPASFLNLAAPPQPDGLWGFDEESLSGILALKLSGESDWKAFALPCVIHHRKMDTTVNRDEALLIRMNCLGLLDAMAGAKGAEAQFFLIGLKGELP